jgi:hypothetical protein
MPRCPAADCSGGGPVRKVADPSSLQIPADILSSVGSKAIYRCSYCGFIWYEWVAKDGAGTIRVAIGFYDNFTKPMEFFATPHMRMREDEPPKKRRRAPTHRKR